MPREARKPIRRRIAIRFLILLGLFFAHGVSLIAAKDCIRKTSPDMVRITLNHSRVTTTKIHPGLKNGPKAHAEPGDQQKRAEN